MGTTPTQPANAPSTQNTYNVGGSLIVPPQPDVITYALRQDQFETLCDGEMSVWRSIRDACIGAFATGVIGLMGILLTMDYSVSLLTTGYHHQGILWLNVKIIGVESGSLPLPHFNPKLRGLYDRRTEACDLACGHDSAGAKTPDRLGNRSGGLSDRALPMASDSPSLAHLGED